jgi:restriction endonuclease Mrr
MTAAHTYEKNIAENPYNDRIENGVLTYTAQGRRGHQEISGRNRRILEQYSAPCPFYCFANEGRQVYTFLGLLELLRHYQEQQIDSRNELRLVWVFEFRIHSEIDIVPIAQAKDLTASFLVDRESSVPEERELVVLTPEASVADATFYEAEHIRSQLIQINPYRFEIFVKDVVERHGFERVIVTRASQDGGIDLDAYVPESDYFFSRTHVQFQVKRWRHSVGSVDINGFRGALSSTAKGVFVTTSHFTRAAAREAQHQSKPVISLLDGLKFSQLVREVRLDPEAYM